MIRELRLRQNYQAILLAALACFLLEVAWAAAFVEHWLKGIGHDRAWLSGQEISPWLQCVTALLSAILIAAAISTFTRLTGPETARRGIKVAVALWVGLSLTTHATEYVFEARPYSLFAINAGFWLLGMIVMGAIVGGWKKTGT